MRNLINSFTIILVLVNAIQLKAQEDFQLVSGQRVRVIASKFLQRVKSISISRADRIGERQYAGRVVALKADTLEFQADGWENSFYVPVENLLRFEMMQGIKSNLGKGAKVGFLVGAGLGTFFGVLAGSGNCLGVDDSADPEGCALDLAIISGGALGLLGTGIGAGIGAAQHVEVWEEVPLEKLKMKNHRYR